MISTWDILGIGGLVLLPVIFCALGAWICFFNSAEVTGWRNKLLKLGALAACVSVASFTWFMIRVLVFHVTLPSSSFSLTLIQICALSAGLAMVFALFGKGPGRILLCVGTVVFSFFWAMLAGEGIFEPPDRPSSTMRFTIYRPSQ